MSMTNNAYSGLHGDEDWPSPAELAALEEHCKAIAAENLTDPAWWEIQIAEEGIGTAAGVCLARCMKVLDDACKGPHTQSSILGITTALSNLQRTAKDKAYRDAMEES